MNSPVSAQPAESSGASRRALAVFAAALFVRIAYFLMIRRTACLDINLDPISDMETFHRWALSIVGGDWLGRGDFHPFHPWQIAVAPKAQWALWYGHVFHQEPLYPYLVALLYLVAPRQPESMILLQLALGAAGCALTYLAARRIAPEAPAMTAGVLSVLYGPYLYYESLMLRDSFLVPLNALILWVVIEARWRGTRRAAGWWWAGAGLLLGLACLARASALPFFVLLVLWMSWERRKAGTIARVALPAVMLAGFGLAMAPAVARNAAVGAPLLKITTRGPIEFINGNNPWHVGIGWFDGDDRRVSAYAREVLARAGGRLPSTIVDVVRGWSGDPIGLARLQLLKLGYFFAPFEMPNNASYSYFRLNCPLLRYGVLSFFWISPLALVGLAASWRLREAFAPIYLFLGTGVAVTVAFYVIARFRAPFMPAILILAALGLTSTVEHVRRARWARLSAATAVIACALAVNASQTYSDEDFVRPQDRLVAIRGYLARGMPSLALDEAEQGRRAFPGFAEFHKAAARIYLQEGRTREAADAFEETLRRDPADEEARRELARLETSPDRPPRPNP